MAENEGILEETTEVAETPADSILQSVKEDVGSMNWDDAFDNTLIRHINTAFMILSQLGVGPEGGYKITSADNVWSEYIQEGEDLEAIRSYVSKRVGLMFDPPANQALISLIERECQELEWRLNAQVENTGGEL